MFRLVAMLFLVGCSGEEVAPLPAPEPAPAPAPEPEPAPAPTAEVMTVDALNAARAANVGKIVTVQGMYSNFTKQGGEPGQLNVPIDADGDPATKGEVLCIMDLSKEAEITAVPNNSELTVTGKVSENTFFDNAMLDGCVIGAGAPAADAPTEEAPKEGKVKGGKVKGGKNKAQ